MDKNNKNTAEFILDTAQSLVQQFGFNGFSYSHIADKVGIRNASIHYYFPNKEDLGEALITRYQKNFITYVAQIDLDTQHSLEKLRKFTLLYSGPVQDYRTCLSVMLSTDLATLSGKVRDGLAQFFTSNLDWLERVLEQGRRDGQLKFEGAADVRAHQFLASLQGAQLLARSFSDVKKFDMIVEGLLSALT
ncbi:TetR/AcrR family transcriptional regulator [Paenibacillus chondroitinus]|uniref:TetR/AcrR family transcriptional regulator n=1 Tax=Paenibacillus chondroitinus TaxID=59842 RepID=A0ABU6DFI1_9BACL|nr:MULTISPECIES: TetR/AcrR family transcriptional regulator [Paenibacillus]MCY9659155.1 TetR/AcrR family transcriptional regulator [Paenibacillus anseongense]MEB4796510.1 TetR/AcrR family transcriptional regulator [Paenibacillus chondroitinus]